MKKTPLTFVYLPGAGGGGEGDLAALAAGLEFPVRFVPVPYPGWQRCMADDCTAELIVEELTNEIAKKVPEGPVRIMGMSLGGHLGYAAALKLQKRGREIAGLCLIDSFMIETSKPTAGWQGRALAQGMDLLHKGRFMDLFRFVRSKAWRALLRFGGRPLMNLLVTKDGSGSLLAADPVAEQELSMRLLLGHLVPWLARLDDAPVPLIAPVALLRTRVSAGDDEAWRRRCPEVAIYEIPGTHQTLFEAENLGELRRAFAAAVGGFGTTTARA